MTIKLTEATILNIILDESLWFTIDDIEHKATVRKRTNFNNAYYYHIDGVLQDGLHENDLSKLLYDIIKPNRVPFQGEKNTYMPTDLFGDLDYVQIPKEEN